MIRRNPRPYEGKTIATWRRAYDHFTPAFAFDPQQIEKWREGLRAELRRLLGGLEESRCPLQPETLAQWEQGSCVVEKVVFDSEPGLAVPAFVLRPREGKQPRPAVICLHDHGPGKSESIGLVDRGCHADMAWQLAEGGYVTLSPDLRGYGEREEDQEWAARLGSLIGQSLLGRNVWDVWRAADYLLTRPEVEKEKLGCLGFGLGGWIALLASALDERFQCLVISGFFGTWKAVLVDQKQSESYYLPGLAQIADLPDVAALIAPRPLFLEQGKRDPLFPINNARQAYLKLRYAYDALGAGERLDMEVFEGGHRFWGARSLGWIGRWLPRW
ncbi:MAG TPA: hypothetical protein EYP85_05585 [Armatimonadetes bacterium]|nr:hypothetical protein [Armatimonadota bacterium]